MKHTLLIGMVALVLSSCGTAKRFIQTPDDLYYSPVDPAIEERQARRDERERYQEFPDRDDRLLRMQVRNGGRWNQLNDFDYWYDPRFDFGPMAWNSWRMNQPLFMGNTWGWNNPWACNNPFMWNNRIGWNNPFMWNRPFVGMGFRPGWNNWGWNSPIQSIAIYKPVIARTSSGSNLSAFRNRSYNNNEYYQYRGKQEQGFGGLLRRAFSNSESSSGNSNSSWDRPARTFSSGTNTSSNAGGRSGGFRSTGSSTSTGRGGRN
jgi:hypothetical protein